MIAADINLNELQKCADFHDAEQNGIKSSAWEPVESPAHRQFLVTVGISEHAQNQDCASQVRNILVY